MRALKALVVVMGIMLIGGFAVLVAVIIGRVSRGGTPPRFFAATTIDIPRGARIETKTAGTDRVILYLALPEDRRQLVIIDLATGAPLVTVELRPAP